MCRDPWSTAGEGGRRERSCGAGMLRVLRHCGGPATATMGSAQSAGDVNCCTLPGIDTVMLIYTQESVAKHAR